jgi:hypothetical protein
VLLPFGEVVGSRNRSKRSDPTFLDVCEPIFRAALLYPVAGAIATAVCLILYGVCYAISHTQQSFAAGLLCLVFILLAIAFGFLTLVGFVAKMFGWRKRVGPAIPPRAPILLNPPPIPSASAERMPYQKQRRLLSRGELAFFDVLRHIVAERWIICPKVRLVDLVQIPQNASNRRFWFRRVSQKHVDFVICDRQGLAPILAIELDDRSHDAPTRMKRDAFVNEVCRVAELPLYRVRCQIAYDVQELKRAIDSRCAARSVR